MTTTQLELSHLIAELNKSIADLETRTAAIKDVREYARGLLAKYEPNQFVGMTAQQAIEFEDKELPSSGIYGSLYAKPSAENQAVNYADESGYTEQDQQAAALVHDAELDPALVELCSNTTIHADKDWWHPHFYGSNCPISDLSAFLRFKLPN